MNICDIKGERIRILVDYNHGYDFCMTQWDGSKSTGDDVSSNGSI